MKCQRCEKESTGLLVQLCDDCFDEWVREVNAKPSTADIGPIVPRLKYKSGGGTVPDKTASDEEWPEYITEKADV